MSIDCDDKKAGDYMLGLSVVETLRKDLQFYEYVDYLKEINFQACSGMSLEECVDLLEKYEKDKSIVGGLTPEQIHDLNMTYKAVIEFLQKKVSAQRQELEEVKKRVAELEGTNFDTTEET